MRASAAIRQFVIVNRRSPRGIGQAKRRRQALAGRSRERVGAGRWRRGRRALRRLDAPPEMDIYLPDGIFPEAAMTLLVKTATNPAGAMRRYSRADRANRR